LDLFIGLNDCALEERSFRLLVRLTHLEMLSLHVDDRQRS